VQRFAVGGLEVVRVVELEVPLPRQVLAIGAEPDALIARAGWATPRYVTEDGQIRFALAATCVVSDGRRVVIDPCISFDQRKLGDAGVEQADRFFSSLAKAGFAAADVDLVLHTHVDGIGWSTRPQGDAWIPGFPNARYLWTASELDRVAGEGGVEAQSLQPLLDSGRVDAVTAPVSVTSHVRLEPAPGHTPGNVNVWIEADGEAAVVVGDLLVHPLQCIEPDWTGLDLDGEAAARTRRAVLADAEARDALVIGPHFPAPGAFRVVAEGEGWRPTE
jgi:glyoxylase-like metal-dependent hydrolase (beta-lactamase superfamily II)